jgi:hypothetical protein
MNAKRRKTTSLKQRKPKGPLLDENARFHVAQRGPKSTQKGSTRAGVCHGRVYFPHKAFRTLAG